MSIEKTITKEQERRNYATWLQRLAHDIANGVYSSIEINHEYIKTEQSREYNPVSIGYVVNIKVMY